MVTITRKYATLYYATQIHKLNPHDIPHDIHEMRYTNTLSINEEQ